MSDKNTPLESQDRDEPGCPPAPGFGAALFLPRGAGLFFLSLIVPDLASPGEEKKKAECPIIRP